MIRKDRFCPRLSRSKAPRSASFKLLFVALKTAGVTFPAKANTLIFESVVTRILDSAF